MIDRILQPNSEIIQKMYYKLSWKSYLNRIKNSKAQNTPKSSQAKNMWISIFYPFQIISKSPSRNEIQ